MTEQYMRQKVGRALRAAGLDPVSVENPAHPGTPDINFVGGWLELKTMERWPARGGVLRIPHFTQQQRNWLRRRWHAMYGRGAWVVLEVAGEWFLFSGCWAAEHLGLDVNREMLKCFSIQFDELIDRLSYEASLSAAHGLCCRGCGMEWK